MELESSLILALVVRILEAAGLEQFELEHDLANAIV